MSDPKRHHFVPEMHLKRFVDETGRLYWFSKRFSDKVVLPSTPTQVFSENHLYNVFDCDGARDSSVESALATVESQANWIIEKIVSAARARRPPNLTGDEKSFWDRYFCCQWIRVPDAMRASGVRELSETEMRDWVADIFREYESEGHELTSDDLAILDDSRGLSRRFHNARAKVVLETPEELLSVLSNKGLRVAIVPSSSRSFAIGSNPIVKLNPPGQTYLGHSDVEAWLPLAHDVAITPALSSGEEKLIEVREGRIVRALNKATFEQSNAIAGRSRRLIESLARKMVNTSR